MKKLIAVLLLAGILLAFAGCGSRIEIRFVFKDDPVPAVVQTDPPTQPPTTLPPETTTAAPETTAASVDTGSAD